MTDDQLEERVRQLVGCERLDPLVGAYIDSAKAVVLARLFPYDPDAAWDRVPERLHPQTCDIAAYLLNRRGAEGEREHSESGVSRTYASAYVPDAMLAGMVPFAGVPK